MDTFYGTVLKYRTVPNCTSTVRRHLVRWCVMAFFEDCPLLWWSASRAAMSSAHISAGPCARMKRATVGSMFLSLDDFLLALGGTETSAVTCSSRNLCTSGVGHVHREKKIVLGSEDCMDRIDVVRAMASGVEPFLCRLQRCFSHSSIHNFVNKMNQFWRHHVADLRIEVI